jgi:hypothetical protein
MHLSSGVARIRDGIVGAVAPKSGQGAQHEQFERRRKFPSRVAHADARKPIARPSVRHQLPEGGQRHPEPLPELARRGRRAVRVQKRRT